FWVSICTAYSTGFVGCAEKNSLQQIFYGAPGTGKSYTINRDTEGEDVIRTTFHPDTDYSTFVGAYKPTTIEEEVMTVIGTKAVPVENVDGSHRKESKIVYEFVQQAFLQAYVAAWKKYAEANGEEPCKQFLVIEEINRGNCAQIFGDLFQLLDRNAQGFSDYPIMADADMKRQLKKTFAELSLAEADSINAMYKGRDVCREVLEGDILLLPGNLYIWATMNTSDQSLFPIDSAFKRRWDWTYRPISDAKEGWKIKANGNLYDWWTFLEKINDKVGSLTNSEDKKLGYFFCKADSENIISAATFVGKVIFYLWNDVFKDYEFSDTIFDDGKGGKLTFDRFYVVDTARETKVVEENIALFLNNLGVEPTSVFEEKFSESDDSDIDEDNNEGDANDGKNRLMVKFSDGTFISGKTKFDSYFEALKKIGLDKVEKIASEKRYQRHGCALITKAEEQGILNSADYSYVEEQGFYIVKGINGKTMRNMLRLISQQLNLQLEVIYE
ncbi:AAA family ATPase, partial [Prevotellamassilia timonensis]|uniref:AAA family ATPase n=1 Tax=Prevotellamassilia timonensis TaxID=1852370 RepID=UPI003076A138